MPEIIKKKTARLIAAVSLFVSVCTAVTVSAQSTRVLERRADISFAQQNYYQAAKWYSAILYDSPLVKTSASLVYPFQPVKSGHAKPIKEPRRTAAQYKLAESYRLCYHYTDALLQYERYVQSKDTKYPLAMLWYGQCLVATDQPEKAIPVFNTFLQKYKAADTFAQKAKQGIADANFRISNRNGKPVAMVTKMNATVSGDGSNFGMQKMDDGSLWFTSSRHEITRKNEKTYPVRLYSVNTADNHAEKITAVAGDEMNTGASSLSSDKLTVYFTGWKETKKTIPVYYTIYVATRSSISAAWSKPVALPVTVNVPGFNAKQPFISRDEKYLFFASDMPGGYGKYDIWMISLDSGHVSGTAINAGNSVNTDAEEATPFYDAESSCLYYSSNGKTGMGGMDIYKNYGRPGEFTTAAVNLGSPVNSVKDDLYYTKERHSDTAYLSSDRASNCCLEIFKAAPITYEDTISNIVKPQPLSPTITTLPATVQQDTIKNALMDSINALTVERLHVNYAFASSAIRKADRPQLEQVVQLLKKDAGLHILIASFTDCIGSQDANIRLSRKRAESVKKYLKSKGIDTTRVNIDFFGKKHFVVACKEDRSYNAETQLANRRSDLIVTHDPNPKWQPTGKELDIDQVTAGIPGSNLLSKNNIAAASAKTNAKDKAENVTARKSDAGNITEEANKTKIPVNTNTTNTRNETGAGYRATADNPATAGTSKYKVVTNSVKEKANTGKNKKAIITATEKTAKEKNSRKPAAVKPQKMNTETVSKPLMRKVTDSLHTVMNITQLLDFTPRLKNPDVINAMTSRTPRKSLEVFTTSDSVKIELYDNGVFDNDSVSVIYNKQLTVYKQLLLTNKPIRFWVKLDPDQAKNEMIFFAENLGITPPNSALMIITDGENKRTEVSVTSDLKNNAVIYFIKVKK